MQPAELIPTADGSMVAIKVGFNASLVNEIKTLVSRRWNPTTKCWEIPAALEDDARAILRRYGPIKDELSVAPATHVAHVIVRAEASSKRTHVGRVMLDGIDLVNIGDGSLNIRPNSAFTIVTVNSSRFLSGDPRHAYSVEYDLVLEIRAGASWTTTSKNNCSSDYRRLIYIGLRTG